MGQLYIKCIFSLRGNRSRVAAVAGLAFGLALDRIAARFFIVLFPTLLLMNVYNMNSKK